MINQFTNRVVSHHFKDVARSAITLNCGNDAQREIGLGDINFAPMLAAAKNRSKTYYMERDPVADELQPVHQRRERDEGDAGRPGADAVRLPAGLQLGGRGHRHQRR